MTHASWVPRSRWCPASCRSPVPRSCCGFRTACGAEIPRWVRLRLQAYGDDVESIKAFGLDVVTSLCEQLRTVGVPALHFYTMNQSVATLEIVKRLGLG